MPAPTFFPGSRDYAWHMLQEISQREVADRLEGLLPGLEALSVRRHVEARAREQAVWSRVHPDRPFPWAQLPAQVCSLDVDSICEHAVARGALIERRPVGEDFMERQPDELAPRRQAMDG
jgi:hypothetical protein